MGTAGRSAEIGGIIDIALAIAVTSAVSLWLLP
jgi:hypothetical protein